MGDIVDLDVADNSVRHRKPAIGVSRNGCFWPLAASHFGEIDVV